MDSTILLELRIISTPEPIDAIGFLDYSLDQFMLVLGEIVRNVEHDIADQAAYGR